MYSIQTLSPDSAAADAYDALAPAYDVLTADYCHEAWLHQIERLARQHGLRGHTLLDIACGTGKSFLPLAARGYEVTGCDISPRMVEAAQAKAPEASLLVADMRALPLLGQFDLATCLDDAVNYLLTLEDLDGFLDGVALNLAPRGVAIFDVNSLRLYREDFRRDWMLDHPDAFIAWTAADELEVISGGRVAATLHVFLPREAGWSRSASRHEQRHWPRAEIERAAHKASLRIAAVYGQHRGARLELSFDELTHNKALYVVTHDQRR
jgi:SAM-dependent methyltransferase